ncbi:hypothetical protein B296_00051602, partial [Ensete ventricosum]
IIQKWKPNLVMRIVLHGQQGMRLESFHPIDLTAGVSCYRHEIVGVVTATGSNVKGFKVGDHVGVGTYVNSCRNCEYCDDFIEVFCSKGATLTFNGIDSDGTVTKGGYSSFIVVHERQVFRELSISIIIKLEHTCPILCTNYGCCITNMKLVFLLFSDMFLVFFLFYQSLTKSLDYIIDTASGDHPFDPYMSLLKIGGVLVLVGFPSEVRLLPISLNMGMILVHVDYQVQSCLCSNLYIATAGYHPVNSHVSPVQQYVSGAKSISGSMTGGTKETQGMLNFCATNQVYPEIEVINIHYINEALERLIKRDVKYRFVIDIANSLN